MITTSAYQLASRFVGTKEVPGAAANPQIMAMLKLDNSWPADDAVAWCSAFVNYIAWLLGLERSKRLNARSWLGIGEAILLDDAVPDCDVVILERGDDPAAGHVGFYAGRELDLILILGGNQGDSVSVEAFHKDKLLGVRRLHQI